MKALRQRLLAIMAVLVVAMLAVPAFADNGPLTTGSASDLTTQSDSGHRVEMYRLYQPDTGEHLASMGSAYNYCLNMGFNASCTPGGGSAFFLHCSTGSATAGCVSVPESTMVAILKNVHSGCLIVIDTPTGIMRY